MITRTAIGMILSQMIVVGFSAVVLNAAQSQAQNANYVHDEILVKFRDGTDEAQKDLARFRVAGVRKKNFKIVQGLEVIKLGRGVSVAEALVEYGRDPQVLYAEPNYFLHLTAAPQITATPNDPSYGSLWGMPKISAPSAWNVSTGNSQLVVAVIDTGIDYTHPDLAANMFRNVVDCNNNGIDDDGNGYIDDCFGIDVANGDSDPMDDHYHGTHVAGTIGAVGNNGIGVVGINWNVKLLACKFFDAEGSATTEGAIECLEYIKELKTRSTNPVNIVASNNSWGGDETSQALYEAINEQRQVGILFISGAGNGNAFGVGQNNDTTPFYPCNYFLANIVCVAATTSNDGKAGFSNYGRRTVHVGAPGQGILSTVPGGTYASLDGTSMATPHVSGLAALLQAQDLSRDWRALKNLILTGGNNISSMSNTITGKRINANGSMTCSTAAVQTRVQPVASSISASPGVPVNLASLNIVCANPNGNVSVSVSSGGTITLLDNGSGSDQAAGDGIYSGQWTPTAPGTYTLTFSGNDRVTVTVANPTINVTPTSLDWGTVSVGSTVTKTFSVSNSGGGVLTGSATTSLPYSIISGGSYTLSAGQSQVVTVGFTPTSAATFLGAVSLTGGAGATVTLNGSGVTPPTLSMTFDGKLRDRVGRSDAALGADGTMDATMTVTVQPGSGPRTVTRLELRNSAGGIWNTTTDINWILGAAPLLDGALYNSKSGSVKFSITDGSSFKLFAGDDNNAVYFPVGSTLTLTVNLSDSSIATVTTVIPSPPPPPPPPPAPTLSMTFDGKLRDRVGQGESLSSDGAMDGTMTVTVQPGSGNRTVTKLELRLSSGGIWDTVYGGFWVLGTAGSLDGPLYNGSNSDVNFAVTDGTSFKLFAGDNANGSYLPVGATATLTANFADGTTATASAVVSSSPPPPPPPSGPTLSMTFEGKLRDRVGQGESLSSDGAMDGTMTVTVQPGSGNRTVTKLELRLSSGGIWDTVYGSYWVLGTAGSLDGPLLNASNSTVNFAVTDGTSFKLFAGDTVSGTYLPVGATATLTANFADGTAATASAVIASSPPPPPPPSGPTLSMTYDGKLRDRVGQGDLLMSDGAMDGTMTVVVQPGSGDRTVTKLELRLSSGGLWDTLSSTIYWVLGAAGSLDGTLYNASSGAVNFAVTDGTNFKLFAGDIIGGTYLPTGATATLTANFADGTSATASAVIP